MKISAVSPGLLALVLLTSLLPARSLAAARPPNILIIVGDDLGYGELGCQGFTQQIPTPNIDSIAAQGIRFTSGYVTGPYCSPTRAGLMTGRYQQRFGHELNPGPAHLTPPTVGLPITEKTMGDRFKAAGYATGWFGKSHLGYAPQFHPLRRGFDEYFGFLGGMHDYLDAASDLANPIQRGTTPIANIDYMTDAFGREAASFIERQVTEPRFIAVPFDKARGLPTKGIGRVVDISDRRGAPLNGIREVTRRIQIIMHAA